MRTRSNSIKFFGAMPFVPGGAILTHRQTRGLRSDQKFGGRARRLAQSVGSLILRSPTIRGRSQRPTMVMSVCVLIAVLTASYSPTRGQKADGQPADERSVHYEFVTLDVVPQNIGFTLANGINNERTVVGEFLDDSTDFQFHGFSYADGRYTVFDVPGDGAINTEPNGINNRGEIVGVYQKPGTGCVIFGLIKVGFLYDHGHFRPLPDAPCGIVPGGINDAEAVAGYYFDVDDNSHGFLMKHGHFFSLDVPDGVFGFTRAYGLNNRAEVVGSYLGYDDIGHGFIYSRGTYTTLNHPAGANGTQASGINDSGDVAGTYLDATSNPFPFHGFVYSRGNWETVDVPGATGGTQISGINDHGDLVGFYSKRIPAPPDHCKVAPCFDLETHGFVATRIEPEIFRRAVS